MWKLIDLVELFFVNNCSSIDFCCFSLSELISCSNNTKFAHFLLSPGTPLQNNTDELWTLLNFVARDEFADREQFQVEFGELKTSGQLDALHQKLKPYLLRREKDNVEKTVPPKVGILLCVFMVCELL